MPSWSFLMRCGQTSTVVICGGRRSSTQHATDGTAARFLVVEHILLRALPEDALNALPLLEAASRGDPWSSQLSFVFPAALKPLATLIERVAREETPAHIAAYVLWLLPEFVIRLSLWLLVHSLYRIRLVGQDGRLVGRGQPPEEHDQRAPDGPTEAGVRLGDHGRQGGVIQQTIDLLHDKGVSIRSLAL